MTKKSIKSKPRITLKRNALQLKNSIIFVLLFAVIGCMSLIITLAAPPGKDQLTFRSGEPASGTSKHIAQPVDWLTWCKDCSQKDYGIGIDYKTQDPWVYNPTQCMWDTDDYFEYVAYESSLAPGKSSGVTECSYESTPYDSPNIRDNNVSHAAYFKISAPSPNLNVTQTFTWDGGQHVLTATPVFNTSTRRYDYIQCVKYSNVWNGKWVAVPDSHGGYGVPVTITANVVNPTSRTISRISGVVQFGWQQYYRSGCIADTIPPLGYKQ